MARARPSASPARRRRPVSSRRGAGSAHTWCRAAAARTDNRRSLARSRASRILRRRAAALKSRASSSVCRNSSYCDVGSLRGTTVLLGAAQARERLVLGFVALEKDAAVRLRADVAHQRDDHALAFLGKGLGELGERELRLLLDLIQFLKKLVLVHCSWPCLAAWWGNGRRATGGAQSLAPAPS